MPVGAIQNAPTGILLFQSIQKRKLCVLLTYEFLKLRTRSFMHCCCLLSRRL